MTVGVVGLGLVGGSLCKAYKKYGACVYGFDADTSVTEFAVLAEAIDGALSEQNMADCDLILIAIPPRAAADYLESVADKIAADTVVVDCCGVKKYICEHGFELAEKYGFTFVGGHPMAGTHNSGFKYSTEDMFVGAAMVLVPPRYDDIELFGRLEALLSPAGFGRLTISNAQRHDEIIAFTSQMAHIVSNAFIKSPTARTHIGYSAGSYKDLTRVAKLNPDMWAELFLENKGPLLDELDILISSLAEYRNALASDDFDEMRSLLAQGSAIKIEVDGQ